ncbi:MAG: serine/threonine-protein kinase [Gemmataceae bacterium]
MEEPVDAGSVAQLMVKLGLVDDHTAREALFELGDRAAPAADLVRLMERRGVLTPLQGGKLLKGDTAGYFLGGYRMLYKISSGTFGRVYRGDDPRSGQIVAIKVLRNKWTDDKQKVDQFMREGRLGMTMSHPNVVGMLAVNQDNNTKQYFIVMEFVEGDNLRNILAIRKKLEPDEALRMMEECASGLAYAWSKGLTHRDIKPTNILISTDKTTKLVDFGLAEISTSQNTHQGAMEIGRTSDKDDDVAVDRTLDYAGLEKATGVGKGDVRSDIYFLGQVLFEMVTGEPLMPVTKDKNVKLQRRRYEEVENTLAKKAPEHKMHPAIQRLIAKAVAFEPHLRFQSPAAFLEAIKATRAEIGGSAEVSRRAPGPLAMFVVEQNQKLQDVFRDKFKQLGFRVLMSSDATQAVRRYQQGPYHALIIDVGTVGMDGIDAYKKVLHEAEVTGLDVAAVLILNEEQSGLKGVAEMQPGGRVLVRPVGIKQIIHELRERIPDLQGEPAAGGSGQLASGA